MVNYKQHLIALSGKIGSGKDTVADIIHLLVGTSSTGRTGRSFSDQQLAEALFDGTPTWVKHPLRAVFQTKRFAQKVKEIASLLTGIPVEKFEDQEFKKSFLGPEWNQDAWDRTEEQMTVRELLQKIGTDCMRDRLHSDVWVNSLFADWKLETSVNSNPPGSENSVGLDVLTQWPMQKWLITDMRFPNELKAVAERGGLTIRIVRPGHDSGSTHESETALDKLHHHFDVVLVNDGSLEELVGKVRLILTAYGLL